MNASRSIRHLHLHAQADPNESALADVLAEILAPLDAVDRRAVVRHVYWRMPDIPTDSLRRAVGGEEDLRDLAGRGPVERPCNRCGAALRPLSRDRPAPAMCSACLAAPSAAVEPARPAPAVGRPWEYEPAPIPHRSEAVAGLLGGTRRWAEDYPPHAQS